jgi:DNA-binding MarR family transcriptional regulator
VSSLVLNYNYMKSSVEKSTRSQRGPVLAWLRLARVFQKLDRLSAEHLRSTGLSVAQFDILAQLGGGEGMTQQQLADRLLVTKGNVCQLLDRMEQRGLLERRQDGRANRLFLTDAGRALREEIVPAHEAEIATYFDSLSPAEQRQLVALLRRLDHALD